jgi:hypothetical protein
MRLSLVLFYKNYNRRKQGYNYILFFNCTVSTAIFLIDVLMLPLCGGGQLALQHIAKDSGALSIGLLVVGNQGLAFDRPGLSVTVLRHINYLQEERKKPFLKLFSSHDIVPLKEE